MNRATSLKFVWRAIGMLPSEATEAELRKFAQATKEGLAAAQKEARYVLEGTVPVESGKLLKSTKFYSEPNGWRINMTAAYAALQNAGGIVSARTKKYLRIPLPEGRRPRKGERGDFVHRTESGKLLVMKRQGKRVVALAILKKQVRVPPSGFLRKAEEAAKKAYSAIYSAIMSGENSGNTK